MGFFSQVQLYPYPIQYLFSSPGSNGHVKYSHHPLRRTTYYLDSKPTNLLLLLNAEKQQILLLQSLVWPDRGLNSRFNTIKASTLTITQSIRWHSLIYWPKGKKIILSDSWFQSLVVLIYNIFTYFCLICLLFNY
jgi:hypothetical protein